MADDIEIIVYYGPLSWFEAEVRDGPCRYLLDAVDELERVRKVVRHVLVGQEEQQEEELELEERPEFLIAASSDYATVQEHAITNFVKLIRDINPERLALHNPPALIHKQLGRTFNVQTKLYEHPVVTHDTLAKFRDDFSDRIVGQRLVRERMLAALYPLTTRRRVKPVVLMFYGPSGVGKTETAQFVNSLLGGELLRKQLSMFQSEKFASYLFGGVHSEPSFARDLLDRSSGVILIDEFDKANTVFHSAFYEIFDEGVFEDKNYRVQLGSSLIICTSNYNSEEKVREALGEALYSRFDALIEFVPLSADEIEIVVDRLVDKLHESLSDEEVELIDIGSIRTKLHANGGGVGNVRKLNKLVDEVFSLELVRAVLGPEKADDEIA